MDVDAAEQLTVSSMTDVQSVDGRTVSSPPPSAEIEIPLELVGCDERLPRRLEDVRPRTRRQLSASPAIERHLSPLHEEELPVTSSSSSSSSSSQSSSSDDDNNDDTWPACCSDKLTDRTPLPCGELAVSDTAPVDGRRLPSVDADVEAVSGSTAVSTSTADWTMIGSRTQHHSASGLTARLGNLLNSAVMKAQKQLGRGQHLIIRYETHNVYGQQEAQLSLRDCAMFRVSLDISLSHSSSFKDTGIPFESLGSLFLIRIPYYHFQDKARFWPKSRFFSYPCIGRPCSRGPCRNIAIPFSLEKLEWRGSGYTDGEEV